MKIKFTKISPYETKPLEGDAFTYAANILNQHINPHSLHPESLDIKEGIVYHSTLQRAVESIRHKPDTKYKPLSILNEIPFDITDLIKKEEYISEGSSIIRTTFIKLFICNNLLHPISTLHKETLDLIKHIQSEKDDICVVSHSFRMKLLEAYIHTKGEIFTNRELIKKFIHADKKTYEFGESFEVDYKQLDFI